MTSSKTKAQLEASAKQYQEALQNDVDEIVGKAKTILTGAVVVGVGFWAAYAIFKSFSNPPESSNEPATEEVKHHSEPSVMSVVKKAIIKELAIFLLGIIKEKAFEYLQELKSDESDS